MRSATFLSGLMTAGIFACVLSGGAAATTGTSSQPLTTQTTGTDVAVGATDAAFDVFLDRLMRSESNGRDHAKNPRSSALGPFQFINSTFIAVMREHFPDEIASLNQRQILALRTKRDIARRAAKAFSMDNMDYLVERGITPTFGHLRLAFLLGPQGAARVLQAPPDRRVTRILGNNVIAANPFMRRMTAADLVARTSRDVSPRDRAPDTVVAGNAPAAPAPSVQPEAPAAAQPEQPEPIRVAAADPSTPATPEAVVSEQPAPAALLEAPAAAADATDADATGAVAKAPTEEEVEPAPAPANAAPRAEPRLVINVKCDSRQASCKRWIDQEVEKLLKIADGAAASRDS